MTPEQYESIVRQRLCDRRRRAERRRLASRPRPARSWARSMLGLVGTALERAGARLHALGARITARAEPDRRGTHRSGATGLAGCGRLR